MKRKLLLSIALICAVAFVLVGCEDIISAVSMRLRKIEGDVLVIDSDDEEVEAMDDLLLFSGYGMQTKQESFAWVELDNVKLAKLDASSEIKIEKDGGELNVNILEGNFFFQVTEPLSDDESMEIRTSSLAIGIRGTCGWVEAPEDGAERVSILEGKVECTAGGESSIVSAGEMGTMTEDGTIIVEKLSIADIPSFVMDEIEGDDELLKSVSETEPDSTDNLANELDEASYGTDNQLDEVPNSMNNPPDAGTEQSIAANQNFVEQYRDIIKRADSYDYNDPYSGEASGGYSYALVQEKEFSVPTLILEKNGYDHPAFILFRYDPGTGTTGIIGYDRATRFEFPSHMFINNISFDNWHKVTDMSGLDAWTP